MSQLALIPPGCMFAGFIIAAIISENALRDIDETLQGRLMKSTAALRKFHLLAIPLFCLSTYFFPNAFWPGITGYFGMATLLVAHRLQKLDLPSRLKKLHTASVATIFVSSIFGWISSQLI